jgi:hypothetical protein
MRQQTSPWKKRPGIILAFLFPGLLQLLRPKPRLRDGILFLLGVGSLIGWIGFLFLLPIHDAPLENFFWFKITDLAEIYPLHFMPAVEAAVTIEPILPADEYLLVRTAFFWEFFAVYCVLYAACAGLSAWDHWRFGHVRS